MENIDHTGDCEEMHNQKLSGDELSDFEFTDVEYERSTKPKDSDSCSDDFSRTSRQALLSSHGPTVVNLQFEFESKTKGSEIPSTSVVKNSVMGLLGYALCRLYIVRIRKGAEFFLEVPIANQSLCLHEVH